MADIINAHEHKKVYALFRSILLDLQTITNGRNRNMGAPGIAEGTNANTIKTAVATNYIINGQVYTKAITDNIAMTALPVQAVSTFCKYLVTITTNGTVALVQGNIAASAALALLPALPADVAPLGYVQVATDGTHTFTSGTTDLSATGITATYADLAAVNSGPSSAVAALNTTDSGNGL